MPLFLLVLLPAGAHAQTIQGRVADAATGEAVARVQLRLAGGSTLATTDEQGRFQAALPAGAHALTAASTGYRSARQEFTIASGETKSFDILLQPELLRRAEHLQVTAAPFPEQPEGRLDLAGAELRNLSTVFINDPLRAVQALPSISSTDDFQSQFAVRGAAARRVGLYLDGVLLHSPFHNVQHDPNSASIAVINGDSLESVELSAGPLPTQFADRTAGALALSTREGARDRIIASGTAGLSNAGVTLEGPIGRARRGSWIASARKSYLQYIIDLTAEDNTIAFGFADVHAKAGYDLTRAHHVSLSLIQARSGLDRRVEPNLTSLNRLIESDYQFTVASLAWRYTPSSSTLVTNRIAWMRERSVNWNRLRTPLAEGAFGEWQWSFDGTRAWTPSQSLRFGGTVRRQRDDGYGRRFIGAAILLLDRYRGSGARGGFYAQESWGTRRFQMSAGARWDREEIAGASAISPYAGLAVRLHDATRLRFSFGQATQFPDVTQYFSILGSTALAAERSTHFTAAIEQSLGGRTRLVAEFYNRQDRDLLLRPEYNARLSGGRIIDINESAPFASSGRGYARGVELLLQRRSANGLTGWVSYTYNRAQVRDGVLGLSYPADYDLRHAFRAFGSARLRPSVNLSARWVSASGLPVPGFYSQPAPLQFALSASRNGLRLPTYHRGDFRLNKDFQRDRLHWSLYVEVINMLHHENLRFDDLNGYDSRTGVARLGFEKLFPILPSAGIVVRF